MDIFALSKCNFKISLMLADLYLVLCPLIFKNIKKNVMLFMPFYLFIMDIIVFEFSELFTSLNH